jgi:hypothetical protein
MKKALFHRGQAVAENQERRRESLRNPCDDFRAMVWYFQSNRDSKSLEGILGEKRIHGRNRRFAQRALCCIE